MALARARALRTLQTSLRHSGQRVTTRVSAPARTQLVQRRYASGGGDHGSSSSDLPWALGAVIVTIPSCWYLWPDSSHAEHHGDHGDHAEHAEEEGGEGEEKQEESGEGEEKPEESGEGEEKKDDAGEQKDDGGKKKDEGGDKVKKGEGKEDNSKEADEKFEKDEESKQDSEPTKDKEGDAQDSEPPGGEEEETAPGGGGGKEEESESKQVSNERKTKKKPDSGQDIKEDQKGKQSGLSTGPTKHSLPIQSDPNKSKKGEGTPETAKSSGPVDPNRPAK